MQIPLQLLAVCVAAITLPAVLELALIQLGNLLRVLRKGRAEPTAPPLAGTFTVIVPAHNEELLIERTIRSLQASADIETRILVVAHNCSDATAALARRAGAQVLEVNEDSGRGKGIALQLGFADAIGEGAVAVGVMDADSVSSSGLIAALRGALGRGAGAQCRYELHTGPEVSPAQNLQALAFRAINTVRARGRSALGLSAGIFGNGFALRSSVLQSVPYGAFSIAEDLEYHVALIRSGQRVTYTEGAQITGAGTSGKAAAAQRSRWEGGRLRIARQSAGPLLLQIARGRFRLIEPLLELVTLPLAIVVVLLATAFAVPSLPLRLYATGGLVLVAIHVLTAVHASPQPRATLNLLLRAPFYIVGKVALLPRVLANSRRNASWERSQRTATPAPITAEDHRTVL